MRSAMIAMIVMAGTTSLCLAERPLQQKSEADAIVVGKIEKITTSERKFGNDGVHTDYLATVEIVEAKKGEGLTAGKTVKVRWFRVTKRPSDPVPGAYGHAYSVKKGDKATFWLVGNAKSGYEVIYNGDGIEKFKK